MEHFYYGHLKSVPIFFLQKIGHICELCDNFKCFTTIPKANDSPLFDPAEDHKTEKRSYREGHLQKVGHFIILQAGRHHIVLIFFLHNQIWNIQIL